ncbi:MAG: DUF6521 family protein [Acidobacteriia bacterium]|nr:DUF6521 family protein [Terriglobia bacterium]
MTAHDIYSETNPAFCAYALAAFIKTYLSINANGPEVPVAYLSLPLALSGDFDSAFLGTNKNTGLLEWLERSPQVQIGLAERVNGSIDIVTEAIRFGCFTRVLKFGEGARLGIGDRKIKTSVAKALGEEPGQVLKRAARLGYWFAKAGSTRAVFHMMGFTV